MLAAVLALSRDRRRLPQLMHLRLILIVMVGMERRRTESAVVPRLKGGSVV